MDLENEIRNNPNASPGQQAWLQEREAKRLKEKTEADLKAKTAPYAEQKAALEPLRLGARLRG